MSSLTPVSEAEVYGKCRAKYYPTVNGEYRLASVQMFDRPVFRRSGFVALSGDEDRAEQMFGEGSSPKENRERATRRAKIAAFDLIACNPDLDSFCTFTFDPGSHDRCSYDDVYRALSIWASNRVQRRGLKYVAVPEFHKDGEAIHFHALATSGALDLERARSPYTGRPLSKDGKPVYNIASWRYGFSTALMVGATETDRDKVVKYIYKYMGKQSGQKIGGRYYLHGGDLLTPSYKISDDPGDFIENYDDVKYYRCDKIDGAGQYYEWDFI